jgi:hypothetical protein
MTDWRSIFEALDKAGFSEDFPNRDLSLPQNRGDILFYRRDQGTVMN